jgi:hypothetical protein
MRDSHQGCARKCLAVHAAQLLSNRVFKSYDESSIIAVSPALIDQPWKIMSIARRDWATIGQ